MFFIKYSVIGSGYFPTDMLRYDSSVPASIDDAKQFCNGFADNTIVTLIKIAQYKNQVPTIGRWNSFGWNIISDTMERFKIDKKVIFISYFVESMAGHNFPLEMLYLDRSYPGSQASDICHNSPVELTKIGFSNKDLPNNLQWMQFGWMVKPMNMRIYRP